MEEKLIFCDACGTRYDISANNTCPACGAGYGYDEEVGRPETAVEKKYRLMEERQEAERQEKFKTRQAELDKQEKGIKRGCLIAFIVIAALIFLPNIIEAVSGLF